METLLSTGFIESNNPNGIITDIKKSQFNYIELDFAIACMPKQLEKFRLKSIDVENRYVWMDDVIKNPCLIKEKLQKTIESCHNQQIQVLCARAPRLEVGTHRTDLNNIIENLVLECIEMSGNARCKYLVVQPLFSGIDKSEIFDVNVDYFARLAQKARRYNVQLLIENQCGLLNGHYVRGFCSNQNEVLRFIDEVNKKCGFDILNICFDMGNAILCGLDVNTYITDTKAHIKAIRMRDNNGKDDYSVIPMMSTIKGRTSDWEGLIKAIMGFEGYFIYEINDSIISFPRTLRPNVISFTKSVADYFEWIIDFESSLKKYSSIVLFGAGNMCKNFMATYGKKYVPLFTCDNNSKIWGSKVYGLEVKSPDSLKEISDDCAVLICNMYYNEIKQQLMNLNIKHIEIFNDEFLPIRHDTI